MTPSSVQRRRRTKLQIDPAQVLYVIGEINYSHLHLVNGQVRSISKTLKWCAQEWPWFLRLHKGVLVNLDYVHEYLPPSARGRTAYVVMNDLARLAVARRRVKEVVERLQLEASLV